MTKPGASAHPSTHRSTKTLKLAPERVEALLEAAFPEMRTGGNAFHIEAMTPDRVRVRLPFDPRNLRPGGTISGPAMFHLADYSLWALIVGRLGEGGIPAVTSSLNITYLRRPSPGDLVAQCRLIRLGRRLAMGDVEIYGPEGGDMLAHATVSYALPHENSTVT